MASKRTTPLGVWLNGANVNYSHDDSFVVDRPHGSGDYLFVHFLTSIRIRDRVGERVLPAGTCILYAPGYPQWYRGNGQGFSNDWCHFGGPTVARFAKDARLTFNEGVQPAQFEPVSPFIHAIVREELRQELHWREGCAALLVQLLVSFARATAATEQSISTPRLVELAERYRELRAEVHARLNHPWTIQEMARLVHLSPSRFARLYRDFFGGSPLDDLIAARMERACWLLSTGTVFVKQAASDSGFTDEHYFSRCFRARMGCAPREYRQRWLASVQQKAPQSA